MNTQLLMAIVISGLAALSDLRTGHIPNALTLLGLAAGVAVNTTLGWVTHGLQGAGIALATTLSGAMVSALVPLFMFRAGGLGGGDVKLFIALGAIASPLMGLEIQMAAFVAAALGLPVRLAYEGRLFRTLRGSAILAANLVLPANRRMAIDPAQMTWFRFGPAIFVGVVWVAWSRSKGLG